MEVFSWRARPVHVVSNDAVRRLDASTARGSRIDRTVGLQPSRVRGDPGSPFPCEYGLSKSAKRGSPAPSVLTLCLDTSSVRLLPLVWILDRTVPGRLGRDVGAVHHRTFSNLLGSEAFWTWIRNSLIVSVGTTLLGLVVAVPAGYPLGKFTGRDVSMFAFLLVQMFPGIIILVPYFW